jgi:hypothetical protein
MKVSRLSTIALGGSLLLAASAMAGNGNTTKKSIHLYENATIEGTPLTPGDYKVEWSGPGPDVQLTILKGKQTVATVPAHVEAEAVPNSQAGYGLKPGKDGNQTIAEIFFAGERFQLKINDGSSASNSQNPDPSGSN